MSKKAGGLGKGMEALLGGNRGGGQSVVVKGTSSLEEIPLTQIEPNPDQPRRTFDTEPMRELSESIRMHGVVQPITLRKMADEKYQIIAGERRFRASSMAGKTTIPAYIIEASDEKVMAIALIENIQREDLNAIEIALSYNNLMEMYGYTHEQLSEKVGKNRSTVTNYLRLLNLASDVQVALKERKIDMGHARCLCSLESVEDQLSVFSQVIKDGLSVRKTEELVRAKKEGKTGTGGSKPKSSKKKQLSDEYELLRMSINEVFTSGVDMERDDSGKGKISLFFKNDEELEKIVELIESIPQN